jgi:hypothetical protein
MDQLDVPHKVAWRLAHDWWSEGALKLPLDTDSFTFTLRELLNHKDYKAASLLGSGSPH